ncbi:MAG: TetR/AcrR family transcriptional regulator [Eubacterium sp.]|nr:TetR/AcrR family transcriptional regulator [Eubacterium sp.]
MKMRQEKDHLTSRDLQAIETKKRIIDTALNTIRDNGYEKTSVKQICKGAQITVGTFYHYFESKEMLILQLLPKIEDYYETRKKELEQEAAPEKIRDYFAYLIDYPFEEYIDLLPPVMKSEEAVKIIDQNRLEVILNLVEEGQQKGSITMEYDAKFMAEALLYSVRGLFIRWIMVKDDFDYRTHAHLAVNLLIDKFKA